MYEYYNGNFFRCQRMVECALMNDRLPARFRATYTKMAKDLEERKGAENHAARIGQMAVWYRYTLQDPAVPKIEDDEAVGDKVFSLNSVIAQSKVIDEASLAAKRKLFDELMKVHPSVEKATKKRSDSFIQRAIGHARTSSM